MNTKYEFSPNCFAKVIISSGYFSVNLSGNLPTECPKYISGDDISAIFAGLRTTFTLSELQKRGFTDYLASQGLE